LDPQPAQIFAKPKEQSSNFGFAVWHAIPQMMPECHSHNDVELNYVERGTFKYLHGGQFFDAHQGELLVFWAGRPHQVVEVSPDRFFWGLTVPLGWFLNWKLPPQFTSRIMDGEILRFHPFEPHDILVWHWQQWLEDMLEYSPASRKVLMLEIEVCFQRLAHNAREIALLPRQQAQQERVNSGQLDRVEQMAHFISTHYGDPITTADIARAVNLNPNYAVSLFHKRTGSTLISFLTKQRLAHAQMQLATTDRKVLDIALEAGFGSASRFYAVFKDAFGISPNYYRTMMQNGGEVVAES
jgi:AraC-like DNA-binding protein